MNRSLENMNAKRVFFLLAACWFFGMAYAQQQEAFDDYRKAAGDRTLLYTGKVENGYPPQQYMNHPYWDTEEFQEGDVCLDGHLYTDLLLRYDTYTKRLAVYTPEKRIAVQVDMRKVDYFTKRGTKFILLNGEFVALLYDSPRMRLLQQIVCASGALVTKEWNSYKSFKRTVRYILQKEGIDYVVASRSSLIKLFPAQKKQLKQFAQEQQLEFSKYRAEALVALVTYADRLTTKNESP